jgi:hypothetical protein
MQNVSRPAGKRMRWRTYLGVSHARANVMGGIKENVILNGNTEEKLALVRPGPERIIFKRILEKLVKSMCHMNRNSSGSRVDGRDSILLHRQRFFFSSLHSNCH